jgi:hypothetical protein
LSLDSHQSPMDSCILDTNLNFGYAKKMGGKCYLRFDDTNPEAKTKEFINETLGEDKFRKSSSSGVQNDPVLFHGSKELSRWLECIDRDSVILIVSVEIVNLFVSESHSVSV